MGKHYQIRPRDNPISRLSAVAIIGAALSFLPACSNEKPFIKETFVMGTRASVTIYGMREAEAERAATKALHELHRIESVMSNWKKNSEISRLNRGSRGQPFQVTVELLALVDSSLLYSKATSGAFDITARPLVQLWGFQGGAAIPPTEEQVDKTKNAVGYDKIAVDRSSSTITLPPGMSLDLAGVAKGHGVDRCVLILKENGAKTALVNLGGNIYALGSPPGKDGWSIGIRDPLGSGETIGSILIKDEAVATSGNYENFVEIDGKRYGHIIDPRSGRPVEDILSVTIIAPTALASDALSTGLFILGSEHSAKILKGLPRVKAIFAEPDGETILYTTFGNLKRILLPENAQTIRSKEPVGKSN